MHLFFLGAALALLAVAAIIGLNVCAVIPIGLVVTGIIIILIVIVALAAKKHRKRKH
jgi:hypothetical protein